MEAEKPICFTGWHGTSEDFAEEILASNFRRSEGDHHWLGPGAYFFIDGVGQPMHHAKN